MIEPELNTVFLKQLFYFPCCLDDLQSFDAAIHKSLLLIKKYKGDAADMGLWFCVTPAEETPQDVVELVPNGKNIPVNKYVYLYIYLSVYYRIVLGRLFAFI